jgi:predicted naringenin-chalcone synthase
MHIKAGPSSNGATMTTVRNTLTQHLNEKHHPKAYLDQQYKEMALLGKEIEHLATTTVTHEVPSRKAHAAQSLETDTAVRSLEINSSRCNAAARSLARCNASPKSVLSVISWGS